MICLLRFRFIGFCVKRRMVRFANVPFGTRMAMAIYTDKSLKGSDHMKAVLQRVKRASVTVSGEPISSINDGLLVLLGVAEGDTRRDAEVLADKIANLRIFGDSDGRMNLSVLSTGGSVLVVSQFTLCADCSHGRRPDFFGAAKPDAADSLYEYFCERMKTAGVAAVGKGVFGADMQVELLNDGPVTIILDSGEMKK